MNRQEILQFLAQTDFPDGCSKPELRETHISWLVLTDQYVYKIKKPVRFSFLDFSNLRQRAYYCRREVLLNSRLCEGLYLGYIAIYRQGERFLLGARGREDTPIDYAVQMHRLPDKDHLPVKLRHGTVHPTAMNLLAQKIADFHREAAVCHPLHPVTDIDQDFEDLRSVLPRLQDWPSVYRKVLQALHLSRRFLQRYGYRLSQRAAAGWYRDVHGDLHSGNIFLQEQPLIFDCIEFSDALRQIDVLNELAFLCMDLEAGGFPEFSERLLAAYRAQLFAWEQPLDEQLFLYYKLYRAGVRLKVMVLSTPQGPLLPEQRRDLYRYAEMIGQYSQALEASLAVAGSMSA